MSSLIRAIRFRTAAMLSLPHRPQAEVARRTCRAAAACERPPARRGDVDDVVTVAARRRAAVNESGHVIHRRDDALREQQPRGEIQIVAGRSHRDDEALAADPELQRLLGDDEIMMGGPPARGARIAATLDRPLDDARAGL